MEVSDLMRIFASKIYADMTELVVKVEDASLLTDIKRAIKMLKGVTSVTLPKRAKKTGIEKGLEDIRKGNVFHAKDSEDLIKQILG